MKPQAMTRTALQWLEEGDRLAALGDREGAAAAFRQASDLEPDNPHGWRRLGDQLSVLGRSVDADAAYGQSVIAGANDPVLRDAALALAENRLDVAERLLKAHLKTAPTDVAAIRMLAELAGRIGRLTDAETLLRRALELAPSMDIARFNLATALHRQNRAQEALEEIDLLLDSDPDNPAWRNLKGAILTRIGNHDAALDHFAGVLRERPDQPKIWMSYGHTLRTLGRRAEAVAAYRRSIDLEPTLGEVWWSLANLKTADLGADDIARMTRALDAPQLGADDRFHLHFALAKALEDAGDYDDAFRHYAAGNRERRALLPYDAAETTQTVDQSIALMTPAFFADRADWGSSARDPIFILGMPRSGSTLIEQILSTHSQVEGTRELGDIQQLSRRLFRPGLRYPASLGTLDRERSIALGDDYVGRTRIYRHTDRPLFIDKMPNNWAFLPFIHLILPNARIIDARRGGMACCFSNFKQHYARGQAFSYDLNDMGRYYADYVRLMDHVDAVLPGRVHRVRHEAMVADTEGEVRRLLDYLDLPFEPACLNFWQTDRAVQTASSEQVRRPIFDDGVDQWRKFATHLAELRDFLGPLA